MCSLTGQKTNMGSKIIYDYLQKAWVSEDQYKENERNRERDMKRQLKAVQRKLKDTETKLKRVKKRKLVVKHVTHVAAATERAKSEIARRRGNVYPRRRGNPYQQSTNKR